MHDQNKTDSSTNQGSESLPMPEQSTEEQATDWRTEVAAEASQRSVERYDSARLGCGIAYGLLPEAYD
jgi:hypothetical protein